MRDLTARANPWTSPAAAWLPSASWLVWPALGALAGALYCAARALGSRRAHETPGWWPVNGLVIFGLFLGLQLKGPPVLQFWFYAVYLAPWAVLAVCALLRGPLERLRPAQFVGLVAVSVGAALAQQCGWTPGGTAVPLAVGAAGLGLASLLTGRRGIILGLALVGLSNGLLPRTILYRVATSEFPTASRNRDYFARVCQGVDAVKAVARDRRPKFWYAAEEPCAYDGRNLSAVWLWGYSIINEHFPALDSDWKCTLAPGEVLVVISGRDDAAELAREALGRHGVELRPVGRRDVDGGGEGYSLTFLEVVAVPTKSQ
jgi:hypothetical protein